MVVSRDPKLILDGMRLRVQEQGDIVRRLKAEKAPESEVKVALEELRARKKQLEAKELELNPPVLSFDRSKLDDLLKQRFFYDQSFSIYGGVQGLYDFGPMGCAMKSNLLSAWRQHFVLEEHLLEVDCSMLTPHAVLQSSGHVDRFTDLMVKDIKTGECFRADHLIKANLQEKENHKKTSEAEKAEIRGILAQLDNFGKKELDDIIRRFGIKSPITNNDLSEAHEFNLMFATTIGPTGQCKGFLRPETAQGIFVNFQRLLQFNQGRIPFGAAQIGSAFRNEISPRSGLIRVREFTMAEIEYFVDPSDKRHPKFHRVRDLEMSLYSACDQLDGGSPKRLTIGDAVDQGIVANETLGYFMARIHQFLLMVGVDENRLRFRQHLSNEMAHYACDCWDAECQTSYGWIECVGCADRSCYDLTQHAKATGARLVAEKRLAEPRFVKTHQCLPNKQALGKAFRGEAKILLDRLSQLSLEEKQNLSEQLSSAGKAELKVGDHSFELDTTMVQLKETEVKMHVEEIVPNVIEPSFGIGRILYAVFEHSFRIREGDEQRTYLSLSPLLAPYKCSVLPLSGHPDFLPFVQRLSNALTRQGVSHRVDESSGSIGRRYARTDQIAIPYGITVDFDTVNQSPATATLRERDSMKQIRVPLDDLPALVNNLANGVLAWSEAQTKYPAFEQQETAQSTTPAGRVEGVHKLSKSAFHDEEAVAGTDDWQSVSEDMDDGNKRQDPELDNWSSATETAEADIVDGGKSAEKFSSTAESKAKKDTSPKPVPPVTGHLPRTWEECGQAIQRHFQAIRSRMTVEKPTSVDAVRGVAADMEDTPRSFSGYEADQEDNVVSKSLTETLSPINRDVDTSYQLSPTVRSIDQKDLASNPLGKKPSTQAYHGLFVGDGWPAEPQKNEKKGKVVKPSCAAKIPHESKPQQTPASEWPAVIAQLSEKACVPELYQFSSCIDNRLFSEQTSLLKNERQITSFSELDPFSITEIPPKELSAELADTVIVDESRGVEAIDHEAAVRPPSPQLEPFVQIPGDAKLEEDAIKPASEEHAEVEPDSKDPPHSAGSGSSGHGFNFATDKSKATKSSNKKRHSKSDSKKTPRHSSSKVGETLDLEKMKTSTLHPKVEPSSKSLSQVLFQRDAEEGLKLKLKGTVGTGETDLSEHIDGFLGQDFSVFGSSKNEEKHSVTDGNQAPEYSFTFAPLSEQQPTIKPEVALFSQDMLQPLTESREELKSDDKFLDPSVELGVMAVDDTVSTEAQFVPDSEHRSHDFDELSPRATMPDDETRSNPLDGHKCTAAEHDSTNLGATSGQDRPFSPKLNPFTHDFNLLPPNYHYHPATTEDALLRNTKQWDPSAPYESIQGSDVFGKPAKTGSENLVESNPVLELSGDLAAEKMMSVVEEIRQPEECPQHKGVSDSDEPVLQHTLFSSLEELSADPPHSAKNDSLEPVAMLSEDVPKTVKGQKKKKHSKSRHVHEAPRNDELAANSSVPIGVPGWQTQTDLPCQKEQDSVPRDEDMMASLPPNTIASVDAIQDTGSVSVERCDLPQVTSTTIKAHDSDDFGSKHLGHPVKQNVSDEKLNVLSGSMGYPSDPWTIWNPTNDNLPSSQVSQPDLKATTPMETELLNAEPAILIDPAQYTGSSASGKGLYGSLGKPKRTKAAKKKKSSGSSTDYGMDAVQTSAGHEPIAPVDKGVEPAAISFTDPQPGSARPITGTENIESSIAPDSSMVEASREPFVHDVILSAGTRKAQKKRMHKNSGPAYTSEQPPSTVNEKAGYIQPETLDVGATVKDDWNEWSASAVNPIHEAALTTPPNEMGIGETSKNEASLKETDINAVEITDRLDVSGECQKDLFEEHAMGKPDNEAHEQLSSGLDQGKIENPLEDGLSPVGVDEAVSGGGSILNRILDQGDEAASKIQSRVTKSVVESTDAPEQLPTAEIRLTDEPELGASTTALQSEKTETVKKPKSKRRKPKKNKP